MANLKNITDVPVVESAEGLNLIVNDNGTAKQIAASAVGAQADWNIEDASNPAYIKNKPIIPEGFSGSWNDLIDKPFYAEKGQIEIFNDTVHFQADDIHYSWVQYGTVNFNFIEGQEYTILWNGQAYKKTAILFDEPVFIGNMYLANNSQDDGTPFLLYTINGDLNIRMDMQYAPLDVNIQIFTEGEAIHKIDTKYLPPVYDFVIVAHNDWTCKRIIGDYNTIYNKLINGDFIDGKVIQYYWTGEDESTNYFSLARTYNDFEFAIGVDGNDKPCIHLRFMNADAPYYCTIRNDNTVFYWSAD